MERQWLGLESLEVGSEGGGGGMVGYGLVGMASGRGGGGEDSLKKHLFV